MTKDLRPLGDPGSEEFRVDAYPFYLLNRAVSRYNVVIEAELRAIGIDIPTWRVLMVLGEKAPRPIAQVARSTVINISTMARIVASALKSATTPSAASHIASDTALRRSGLLKTRWPTPPSLRHRILSVIAARPN